MIDYTCSEVFISHETLNFLFISIFDPEECLYIVHEEGLGEARWVVGDVVVVVGGSLGALLFVGVVVDGVVVGVCC